MLGGNRYDSLGLLRLNRPAFCIRSGLGGDRPGSRRCPSFRDRGLRRSPARTRSPHVGRGGHDNPRDGPAFEATLRSDSTVLGAPPSSSNTQRAPPSWSRPQGRQRGTRIATGFTPTPRRTRTTAQSRPNRSPARRPATTPPDAAPDDDRCTTPPSPPRPDAENCAPNPR